MAEANWFWAEGDKQHGPVLPSAIARLVADGKLGASDLIWKEGMTDWIPVQKVPGLVKYLKSSAPPAAAAPTQTNVAETKTNALAAAMSEPEAEPAPESPAVIAYQTAAVDRSATHEFVSDPNATVICPHCSAGNVGDSQFCHSCGMALPVANSGPRIISDGTFASTSVGQHLQSDQLHKSSQKASTALLWVAIIQTGVVGFIVWVAQMHNRISFLIRSPVVLGIIAFAGIFWGLYIWSRRQPLPAAIVGLVLYCTMLVLNIVNALSQIGNNTTPPGYHGGLANTGVGWIDIIIVAVLAQAISAGLKHRKMHGNVVQPAA